MVLVVAVAAEASFQTGLAVARVAQEDVWAAVWRNQRSSRPMELLMAVQLLLCSLSFYLSPRQKVFLSFPFWLPLLYADPPLVPVAPHVFALPPPPGV